MPVGLFAAIAALAALVVYFVSDRLARFVKKPSTITARPAPVPTRKSERALRMQIECLAAGHLSESYAPAFGGMGGYGEKWGRSAKGELVWIYLFQDEFFPSIESHVEELVVSGRIRAEASQDVPGEHAEPSLDILGELADPSPSGQPYDFNNRIYCPVCGSSKVRTLTAPESAAERVVLPVATHRHWDNQTEHSRRQLIIEALDRKGWLTKPVGSA